MAETLKDKYRMCREQQRLFSKAILEKSLYRYQERPAQWVLDQVRQSVDSVTVIEMPQQAGKNEMSAHLELNILAQKKIIEYRVSYSQGNVRTIARQLMQTALVSLFPSPLAA